MKLTEIKTGLIDYFLDDFSQGIKIDKLDEIYESMGQKINLNIDSERIVILQNSSSQSSDPSKAFKKFTDGRVSILTIIDEDDNAIMSAIRSYNNIISVDLTSSPLLEKNVSLISIKNALRQAKNRNDDISFNIISTNSQL